MTINEVDYFRKGGVDVTDIYLGDYDVDVKGQWNEKIINAVSGA